MRQLTGWWVAGLMALAAGGALAEDPAEALTRGKLELDVGNVADAAKAFASVVESADANDEQRWEARIRLAVARQAGGDLRGYADALEEAWKTCRDNPEALRLLFSAAGSALPGADRWENVWQDVRLEIDRRDPDRPLVEVVWPGVPPGQERVTLPKRISIDFVDADYSDDGVLRSIAEASGMNLVVMPGVHGRITYHAQQVPLETCVRRLMAPNGYLAVRNGPVIWIGPPETVPVRASRATPARYFADNKGLQVLTGKKISFEYRDVDLLDVLREVAAHGGARVEIPEGIGGRVTFKLTDVPWDQAFDLVARVNGLDWERAGDTIRVWDRHQ